MSEENEIIVLQTTRFFKAFKKFSNKEKTIIDDEIGKIILNPQIGENKKGDLSHILVHKFNVNKKSVLLGYSFIDDRLELYLLKIGSHENFYSDMKKNRRSDIEIINNK